MKEVFYIRLSKQSLTKVTAERYNETLYLVNFNSKDNKHLKEEYYYLKGKPYGLFDIKSGLNVVYCKHRKDIASEYDKVASKYLDIILNPKYYNKCCNEYQDLLTDKPLSTLPKFSIDVIDDIDED